MQKSISVVLPCLNEEKTIRSVVKEFQKVLPQAQIVVFDNASTDRTSDEARAAGAKVVFYPRKGKGNVVRHIFDTLETDYVLMADGDGTYPAEYAPKLLELASKEHADMVVGIRMSNFDTGAFRNFHIFGNHLVAKLISKLFKTKVTDVLSGYRVFSKDFIKTIPLQSSGFEIETEMTLQAAAKGFRIIESPIHYLKRPEGSFSKLNTFSDGFLILKSIFMIFKDFKPLFFFSTASVICMVLSLVAGIFPILDYINHHYVYRVPLAILATGLAILSVLLFGIGLILDTAHKYHLENYALWKKTLSK